MARMSQGLPLDDLDEAPGALLAAGRTVPKERHLLGLLDRLVEVPNCLIHRDLGGLGGRLQIVQCDVALVTVIIVRDPAAACQAHACPPLSLPSPSPNERLQRENSCGWP